MNESVVFQREGWVVRGSTSIEDGSRYFFTLRDDLDGQVGTLKREIDGGQVAILARLRLHAMSSGGWIDPVTREIPKESSGSVYEVHDA